MKPSNLPGSFNSVLDEGKNKRFSGHFRLFRHFSAHSVTISIIDKTLPSFQHSLIYQYGN